jgi:hypothetical protein
MTFDVGKDWDAVNVVYLRSIRHCEMHRGQFTQLHLRCPSLRRHEVFLRDTLPTVFALASPGVRSGFLHSKDFTEHNGHC